MARKLTHKERGFVNDIADGKPGVHAALNNYDTKDYHTAAVIASENLTKPDIIAELKKLGFDANNAKRVIGEILNKEYAEDKDRLKAGEIILKVTGEMNEDKKTINFNTINVFQGAIKDKVEAFEATLKQELGYVTENKESL